MYYLLTIFLTQVSSPVLASMDYEKCISKQIPEQNFRIKINYDGFINTGPPYYLICNFNFTDVCLPVKISSIDELKKAPLIVKYCHKSNNEYFCETDRFAEIFEAKVQSYVFTENDKDAKVFHCGLIENNVQKCTIKPDGPSIKRGSARLIDDFNCVKDVTANDKPENKPSTDDKPVDKPPTVDKPVNKPPTNDKPASKIPTNDKPENKISTNNIDLVAIVANDVIISKPDGEVAKKTHFNLRDVIEARIEETICTVAGGCRVVRQKFAPFHKIS